MFVCYLDKSGVPGPFCGDRDDTRVDVIHPQSFDDKKPSPQRKATLALLKHKQLKGNASPKALSESSSRWK